MMTVEDVIDRLKTLTLDEKKHVHQQLDNIMTIAPKTTATTTTKKKAPVAPQPTVTTTTKKEAPGESTIKKETLGEWTIKILTLFKADASDVSKTAIPVLNLGLVTLSTVKLLKKDEKVLRKMVQHVGQGYLKVANDKQKDLSKQGKKQDKKLASPDTMKGFLVHELIRHKKRLAKKDLADNAKMAPAAKKEMASAA